MNNKESENDERDFSIELASNRYLMRFSTSSNGGACGVLIEGTLGRLRHALFVEPQILEVKGSCGVLRLNLTFNEVKDPVKKTGGEEL